MSEPAAVRAEVERLPQPVPLMYVNSMLPVAALGPRYAVSAIGPDKETLFTVVVNRGYEELSAGVNGNPFNCRTPGLLLL